MKFNLSLENINYIKITYRDPEGVGHVAKAVIKQLSSVDILACMKYEDSVKIPYPQDVQVSIACDNALYKANTTLKFVESDDLYVYFTLKLPQDIEYKQNREFFRVKMDESVLIRFKDTVIPSRIYDISANGIKVKLDKSIQFPEEVMLDILFSTGEIKTKAKFIRQDNEEGIAKASFEFENMSETNRDIIAQKCIQKQLEDRRKALM